MPKGVRTASKTTFVTRGEIKAAYELSGRLAWSHNSWEGGEEHFGKCEEHIEDVADVQRTFSGKHPDLIIIDDPLCLDDYELKITGGKVEITGITHTNGEPVKVGDTINMIGFSPPQGSSSSPDNSDDEPPLVQTGQGGYAKGYTPRPLTVPVWMKRLLSALGTFIIRPMKR